MHMGQGVTEVLSRNGMLIEDIRRSSSLFPQVHYSHVDREDKKVAHSLARYAMHILDLYVWKIFHHIFFL